MDIKPQQPISDDQELAKVLAGFSASADKTAPSATLADDLEQENETNQANNPSSTEGDETMEDSDDTVFPSLPMMPVPASPETSASTTESMSENNGQLESIKLDALKELRPLVDKLNVSPEEKFDTYLLLIRSTDDTALISPAHDAAKDIADDARRAQALLDIIKEIDYLSGTKQQ